MKTVEKKYLLPFCLVTVLFLLWGIANNMTDTLLQGKLSDLFGVNVSFLVPVVCFAVVLLYARGVVYNSVDKNS